MALSVGMMSSARADTPAPYPSKPLTLVIGFAPSGPNDILGRTLAKSLAIRLGQPIQVVNRAGGSGNPATGFVAHAPADGYTLLLIGPANAINASLFSHLDFDFRRDIEPVAGITREAMVMVTHPSMPTSTVAEFMRYAAVGGRASMASTGVGSAPHVSALLFNRMTSLALPIVQFDGGGPALQDLIAGGRAQVMFEPMSAAVGPVRDGRLRALAVTGAVPSPALPGIPVLADTLAGYEASAVTGIGVPRDTPQPIVDRLNREINAVMADPQTRPLFADNGGEPLSGSPADFARLIVAEIDKWAAVVKAAGLRTD